MNEHSFITNIFLCQMGYLKTQINPVTTNKNELSRADRYTEFDCNLKCETQQN
jgi:hypothetical protein